MPQTATIKSLPAAFAMMKPCKPTSRRNRTGNPIPGQFAYGDAQDCVGTASFEIPLDDIDGGVGPGDSVTIAAHAEAEAEAEAEDGKRVEGAWGKGARFVARGIWAMYFTYEVQEALLSGNSASKCVFTTSTIHTGGLAGPTRSARLGRRQAAPWPRPAPTRPGCRTLRPRRARPSPGLGSPTSSLTAPRSPAIGRI